MVLAANLVVENDEIIQARRCTEEWKEYLCKFLTVPLSQTDIQRLQCVERGTCSQLLEHWSELIHRNLVLSEAEAFKTLLLSQNPAEQLQKAPAFFPLKIIADVELLQLYLCLIDSIEKLSTLLSISSDTPKV